MIRWAGKAGLVPAVLLLAACAPFPTVEPGLTFDDGLTARELLDRSIEAHGGDLSTDQGEFTLEMTGEWSSAIVRIQPLVTDAGYRIDARERYRPAERLYIVDHRGPEGVKTIRRQGQDIQVWYDGEVTRDEQVLAASAMTTDAFELFHFGPSFLERRAAELTRLSDRRDGGVRYRRLLAVIRPGFGEATEDRVVVWLDPETDLMYRVHITLNGFETTQGAHVDTTFLEFHRVGAYTLPSRFVERVRGPIRLRAHDWWITAAEYAP
ncbi:MAG: hypothetical protein V2J10_09110 [Wenzhouxiangella sp.]|nr:hypothetical protein [Wenzhouxiangella sp.]